MDMDSRCWGDFSTSAHDGGHLLLSKIEKAKIRRYLSKTAKLLSKENTDERASQW